MSLRNLLKETVTIQGLKTQQNAMGGNDKSFADTPGLTGIRAGFFANRISENQEFSKTTLRNSYRMYLEYSSAASTIEVEDRVIWGDKTLEIRAEPYNPGSRNKLFHVECELIE